LDEFGSMSMKLLYDHEVWSS